MFERFGEINSVEELNEKAMELRESGKIDDLKAFAIENGLTPEDVEEYLDEPEDAAICTVSMAAIGKLEVEKEDLNPVEIIEDWYNYVTQICMEDDEISRRVRLKSKSLKGCIAYLLEWSLKNSYKVDQGICRKANISVAVKMGIPGMARAKRMIKEYYMAK